MADGQDFSLVLGGPLFALLRRWGLSDDDLGLLGRRIAFFALITWAPLPLLAAAQGSLFDGGRSLPFLNDVDCHLRFLIAVPLLFVGEVVVHRRMPRMIRQFQDRGLVPPDQTARFTQALGEARRLRDAVAAEALMVILVYAVGVLVVWRQFMAVRTGTWYDAVAPGRGGVSLAGLWFGFVSLPIFQFLMIRWYFRLFIWARLLFRTSRLNLDLKPAHSDGAGGLGFLGGSLYAFMPVGCAHGVLLAGLMADRIFSAGAKLTDFKLEPPALVLVLLVLFAGPTLVFTPMLARLRLRGLGDYGALAQRYARAFDAKWLRGGAAADERLVGSADIQSLADLANSYSVVEKMRITPVSTTALVQFAGAVLVPIVPLALTVVPAEKLIRRLVEIVL